MSAMFGHLRTRDEPYLSKIRNVSYLPVFILGHHRSGTTLLYELMGMSGAFKVLTAYHVLYYDELLANHFEGTTDQAHQKLNDWFDSLNIETRFIDNVKLNANMPEEYGMILHAKSRKMSITQRNFPIFEQICRKIQVISDPSCILLLKNPWDFDRFLDLKKMMPAAKFVFIHRNPIHVLNSQLKALHASWSETNPYTIRLSKAFERIHKIPLMTAIIRRVTDPSSKVQLIRHILIARIIKSMNYYIQNIESLPPADYVSLRYEDLCDNPKTHFPAIFDIAGVKPRVEVPLDQHIGPRPLKLLPTLVRDKEKLRKKFQDINGYLGYDT
jgi:hypothetical protein